MFYKWNKINFEFNQKFRTKGQIMKDIDKQLREEGRSCTIMNIHYIIVDGKKYRLKEEVSDCPEVSNSIKKVMLIEVPKVSYV